MRHYARLRRTVVVRLPRALRAADLDPTGLPSLDRVLSLGPDLLDPEGVALLEALRRELWDAHADRGGLASPTGTAMLMVSRAAEAVDAVLFGGRDSLELLDAVDALADTLDARAA